MNKEAQQQFQRFRICILTNLCPCNEQCRLGFWCFFLVGFVCCFVLWVFCCCLVCLWEGNVIQVTTGMASREQKTVKCCIAGKSLRKCHMPFWNKLLSDTRLKYGSIWLSFYISYYFSPFLPMHCSADSPPPPGSSGVHFPDVANHSFGMVSQCRGWGEGRGKRRRRGETRSDLTRLRDAFSIRARHTQLSLMLYGLSLWALLISINILQGWNLYPKPYKGKHPIFPCHWKLICQSVSNCVNRIDACNGFSGLVQIFGLNWYFFALP